MDRYDPATDAAKFQALMRFSASIAEHLQKIAMTLTAEAEMLSRPDAAPRLGTIAALVRRTARRTDAIVNDLLTVAGKQQIEPKALALSLALGEVLPLLSLLVADSAIDLNIASSKELPLVSVDVYQFERIISTLVTRAVEAMPTGGIMTIVVNHGNDADRRAIGADCIRLEIADSGAPISAPCLRCIFDPVLARRSYGLWLGLATIYGAICQMGGRISVASSPGVGTCFSILLPAIRQQQPLDS